MSNSALQTLMQFLSHCPSSWQATQLVQEKLQEAGFRPLEASQSWQLQDTGRYFCRLQSGALIAFIANFQATQLALLGCHTESPYLRLKDKGFIQEQGLWMAHVEAYGSPILSSWFFKDLAVCAHLLINGPKGPLERWIVIDEPVGILLSPAIHLARELNEKGLAIDKQQHLKVLIGSSGQQHPLRQRLEQEAQGEILAHEVLFYPLERARQMHLDEELIASWRIDNLASCAACVEALIATQASNSFCAAIFANHEEIGSATYSGAHSSHYSQMLDRAFDACSIPHERQRQMLLEGLFCSVDGAHGLHPAYNDLYEANHKPRLGLGPVIKFHAGGKYATDVPSAARIAWLAKKAQLPVQSFHIHANLPCGSTIGPILSTSLGMPGVDIGLPQLAMHASRELMHAKDYLNTVALLKLFLSELVGL